MNFLTWSNGQPHTRSRRPTPVVQHSPIDLALNIREPFATSTANPFMSQNSYIDDISAHDQFLRPQVSISQKSLNSELMPRTA